MSAMFAWFQRLDVTRLTANGDTHTDRQRATSRVTERRREERSGESGGLPSSHVTQGVLLGARAEEKGKSAHSAADFLVSDFYGEIFLRKVKNIQVIRKKVLFLCLFQFYSTEGVIRLKMTTTIIAHVVLFKHIYINNTYFCHAAKM